MAASLRRLADPDLNLVVYHGAVSREDLLAFWRAVDENDPRNGAPWLSYYNPETDISELDLMTFVELKRIMEPKLRTMSERAPVVSAMVCDSRLNGAILSLWKGYVGRDPDYMSEPNIFTSIEAACRWIGLDPSAHDLVAKAVQSRAA
ncbi:MAG TPA: hypothetical protein VG407_02295 [Caulobacteraceae bacterium]|jgi:hypothetical protein|nr:hypothetical protein [Caulobacteraceae bacterium]